MKQVSCLRPEVFDTWADVYDKQPNPLLSLEQRVLGPMLPDVRGLDVLDAGCGTGRWLSQLAKRFPRSLFGVDISPQMLLLAAAKLGHNCELRLGSCTALPFSNAAADMVLSSFVVSYLGDLETFAQEIDRVARPGTTIFLTDMHPDTEASCNWKRSFQAGGSNTEMQGRGWSLKKITRTFMDRGFEVVSLLEPTFSPEERQIFEKCGRLDLYHSAATLPAIYVLQLRKPPSSARHMRAAQGQAGCFRLTGARCAVGPEAAAPASVSIRGKYIHSVRDRCRVDKKCDSLTGNNLDLSGYLLLPGLINAHDHLEFGLFPNIGEGPYQNAAQWARDIHSTDSALIARHRKVPRTVRLWWGAIRNLLCGVTTVCHHNPVTPELVNPEFPIRVISEFAWAHSLSLEPQLTIKFAECHADLPFILHVGEGIDEESRQEVFALDRMRSLDQRTVLVHGIACTPEAVALINQRLAALVLCPTSNEFLFRRSPSLAFVRSVDAVVLGSDSPLTAAGDLLDEVRFAHAHIGLDANSVYAMVTNRAADVLRLRQGEGRIWPGSVADIVAVRDIGLSPADTLAQLTIEQIELVIVAGRVQLASPSLIERLPTELCQGLQLFEVDGHQRWVRAPIDELLANAEEVLEAIFVWAERECEVPLLHEEGVVSNGQIGSALTFMPILILNVHSHCNCRCVMCDIWKRETHEQIKVADLERHRASLRNLGVRQVVLSGGEPLLHNDLRALCDFFREQNIHLTLLTTGLLLLKRANDVCRLFDEVIVSIDGPRETHDAIRRVKGAFDLISQGVSAVRAQQPGMRITCRTTVQKANHRHLRATVTAARTVGFDSISFLAADMTSEAFNRPLVWPGERQSEIALTVSEVAALEDEIEQLIVEYADDIRHRYIAEPAEKLRRIPRRFREHLGQAHPASPVCNAPWVSAVVEVDGSVRPCFFHRAVGSIGSSTLEEVVNGKAARVFRESLSVSENPTCRRCVCSLNYH